MRLHFICFLILIFNVRAFAQNSQKYLVLENARKYTRKVYSPGEEISFKTHDSKAKFSGRIVSVNDSVLVIVKVIKMENEGDGTNNVYKDYVPLKEIAAVYYVKDKYWRFFRGMYAGTAMIGGVGMIGIAGLNYITDSNRTPIDKKGVQIAAGLAISGALVALFGGKNYKKLKGRWRLRAMDSFDPND